MVRRCVTRSGAGRFSAYPCEQSVFKQRTVAVAFTRHSRVSGAQCVLVLHEDNSLVLLITNRIQLHVYLFNLLLLLSKFIQIFRRCVTMMWLPSLLTMALECAKPDLLETMRRGQYSHPLWAGLAIRWEEYYVMVYCWTYHLCNYRVHMRYIPLDKTLLFDAYRLSGLHISA